MITAAERRNLFRQQSEQRHQESYNNKDSSGQYKDFYEPDKKTSVRFWKPKEGEHDIIIVPGLTGTQHPKYGPNQMQHEFTVFVHRQIGINKDQFVCLNRTFGEPCPICEHLASFEEPSEATIKAYAPSKRTLYNVIVCDSAEEESKGVQIWEVSAKLFTAPLEVYSHKKREGGEVRYADIDKGKVINFVQSGKKLTLEYGSFEFKNRRPLTDDDLMATACLDELIHKPSYDELATALKSGLEAKGETMKAPANASAPKKDNPPWKEEKPSEQDVPEFDPPKKEEPAAAPVSSDECPYGAVFGTDYDEYEECKECPVKTACIAKKEELSKPAEPPKKRLTRRER